MAKRNNSNKEQKNRTNKPRSRKGMKVAELRSLELKVEILQFSK